MLFWVQFKNLSQSSSTHFKCCRYAKQNDTKHKKNIIQKANMQLAKETKTLGAINNCMAYYNDSNKKHDDVLAHPIHQHR